MALIAAVNFLFFSQCQGAYEIHCYKRIWSPGRNLVLRAQYGQQCFRPQDDVAE